MNPLPHTSSQYKHAAFAAPIRSTDADLTAAVELLLLKKGVCSNLLNVRCNKGIVELVGSTDSLHSQKRATEIVSKLPQVRSVINNIKVRALNITDDELHRRVLKALTEDTDLAQCVFLVTVSNGNAELSGCVDSAIAADRAEEVMTRICGVLNVLNHTHVTAPNA
jgi:osmotically-inducible protein OsmY